MKQKLEEWKKKSLFSKGWREFFEIILLALVLAVFVRSFLLGVFRISTSSMEPTLRMGDFIVVSKISYGLKIPFTDFRVGAQLPQRGDLVFFRYPQQDNLVHIKRLVGLPGDHIYIQGQKVFVNDQVLPISPLSADAFKDRAGNSFMRYFQEQTGERSYAVMYAADELQQKDIGPLVVPPGEVFLMGDNRDASADSRYWGSLPLDTIDGRVLAVWFSLDWSPGSGSQGPQVRWERLGLQF